MSEAPILIVDLGNPYTQLLARRIREANVYCEIVPYTAGLEAIEAREPKALILSGSAGSLDEEDAPAVAPAILELAIPTLGIGYGATLLANMLGGTITRSMKFELHQKPISIRSGARLFSRLSGESIEGLVAYADRIDRLPETMRAIASTDRVEIAAFEDTDLQVYGVAFHPEVDADGVGRAIIEAFLFEIAGASPTWTPGSFVDEAVDAIRAQVGEEAKVLCALSGGVDSGVAAKLVHRAVGDRLTCIFVDNGLLRKGEAEKVIEQFRDHFHINLVHVDASEEFLHELAGVADPEMKRKIIGRLFIEVFEREARRVEGARFLVQGTVYPDIIESVSLRRGKKGVIKSHHNVGGLPERMNLELVEPLRLLFKDEVRAVGLELGMPRELVFRQPFPGPGLGVRSPGPIEREKLDILREADAIFIEEIKAAGFYEELWQSFAVILPVKTVGAVGEERTYEYAVALRAVTGRDGMTADWARLPYDLLAKVSNRIINEVKGCNRVCYDISSKPPATIEWE